MSIGNAYGSFIGGGRPSGNETALVTRPILPLSAFGDIKVENSVPIVQMTAVYGLTDKQETFVGPGSSVSAEDGMFVCTSGTNANGFAAITSRRQAKYRAGQGLLAKFSAIFDTPQTGSVQRAGLTNNTDQVGFGYLGTVFGITYNHSGASEVQELTITTPASGGENATVTIDGDDFTVALTAGTEQHNAIEITTSLNLQVAFWDFSSNGDQIVARALVAAPFAGSFSFSSSTAECTFTQIAAGVTPTNTLIPQANWSVGTRPDLDPTKGNIYQVQFQYLGFGCLVFSVENSITGELEVVHTIQYANANVVPNMANPTFRVGWAVSNIGSTTSMTVKGGSASMFNEGPIVVSETPRTVNHTQTSIPTTGLTNILTFRNRLVFNGKRNRVETEPFIISVVTDSIKGALIQVSKNTVPTSDLVFSYVDKDTSTSEIATDTTLVTGGDPTVSFIATQLGVQVNLSDLGLFLFPGESFTLSARTVSGSAADVSATIIFIEDQ